MYPSRIRVPVNLYKFARFRWSVLYESLRDPKVSIIQLKRYYFENSNAFTNENIKIELYSVLRSTDNYLDEIRSKSAGKSSPAAIFTISPTLSSFQRISTQFESLSTWIFLLFIWRSDTFRFWRNKRWI